MFVIEPEACQLGRLVPLLSLPCYVCSVIEDLKNNIQEKKARLDQLRSLHSQALEQLRHYYDIELTYTSNAIEGNQLTYRETAEIIEHGITVGGKRLRDHLEAEDHYAAVQWIRALAATAAALDEAVVTELHRRIVARSQPDIAGVYSPYPRRVAGSVVIFPNLLKIPDLMRDFGQALARRPATPDAAFAAHFDLTAIHPFSDGNGRTARLLMNLILIRGSYPPIAIRPEDRKAYLDALEHASLTGDQTPYQGLMLTRLDAILR